MERKYFPDDKYLSMVRVGPKGQIVIPAEVREMFGIQPGDKLLLLADIAEGIALPAPSKAADALADISKKLSFDGGKSNERCGNL